ncbi:hypothetical protein V9T40_013111 [Parthenolecanium corni]|uniref:Uncharacterized protein n=1 Tax=Parthenolecanium corni TaxID=536013 RepID=A0AAN9TMW3_9HEMI
MSLDVNVTPGSDLCRGWAASKRDTSRGRSEDKNFKPTFRISRRANVNRERGGRAGKGRKNDLGTTRPLVVGKHLQL